MLGVEWLCTLGQITADFSVSSISFPYQYSTLTLTGDLVSLLTPSILHQLCHFIHTDSVASFHLFSFHSSDHASNILPTTTVNRPDSPLNSLPIDLKHLLLKFQTYFNQPHGLPPKRPHDHHIPLLTNTSPVNVKLYHYPHSQKEIIATFIQDMLKEGIITPGTSPFSSLVLLVRKKDGSW